MLTVGAGVAREPESAHAAGFITLYKQASNVYPQGISGTAGGDIWYGGLAVDNSGGHPHMWRITTGGAANGDFLVPGGVTGEVRQVAAAPGEGAYFTEAW